MNTTSRPMTRAVTRDDITASLRAAVEARSNAEAALARSVDRLVEAAADTARCRERVAERQREYVEAHDALMALTRAEREASR